MQIRIVELIDKVGNEKITGEIHLKINFSLKECNQTFGGNSFLSLLNIIL